MAKKQYLYEKIQPEIIAVLEAKVEQIKDRFGVVYVPQFSPREIWSQIPTEAGIGTVKKACRELYNQDKIHGWLEGPYSSVRIWQLKADFYSGKLITVETHERRMDEQDKKVDQAWGIIDTFRRFGLKAYHRRMCLGHNDPYQNVILFDEADFEEIEAFLKSRIK